MSTSPLAPAVAAYPTRCGIWLIPDTPDGRDLMATVKVGPHTSWDDLPDFDPFLMQVILGVLAALTLWAAFAMGTPEDSSICVTDGLLELLVGARAGVAVGPPAQELHGVPEAPALELVEGDLDDPLGPQRHEADVLAGAEA